MSAQQDLTVAHEGHGPASSHSQRRHRDSEQDFILTGARIGNVHGGRTVSCGGSSGRSSPFGAGSAALGDVSMNPSLQQQQRFRIPSRNTEGFPRGLLSSYASPAVNGL